MEIRTLTTFLKVAETQSFTQAAALLGYSQSAVTIQIRQLEKELKVQLFDRIGKQISLTDAGRQLMVYANTIIDTAEQAVALGQSSSEPEGLLRIGTVDSLATTLLPDLLYRLHQRYPKIRVEIQIIRGLDLLTAPRQNQVDAVFTVAQPMPYHDIVPVFERWSALKLIAPKDRFPAGHAMTPQELAGQPFILTESPMSYRDYFDQWMASHGQKVDPIMTLTIPQVIVDLVSRGMGLAFLPEYTFRSALDEGKVDVLDVPGLNFSDCIQLYHHRDKHITLPMEAFFALVREVIG